MRFINHKSHTRQCADAPIVGQARQRLKNLYARTQCLHGADERSILQRSKCTVYIWRSEPRSGWERLHFAKPQINFKHMKIVLVEDEQLALEQLEFLLQRYNPEIEIVAQLTSVKEAVQWFSVHPAPELAFFDIQLTDGSSFEILEQIALKCPIIFATAYQEYTLQAFKTNGIAYILKPYDLKEIETAMGKYQQLRSSFEQKDDTPIQAIQAALQALQQNYKERFLVKSGSQLVSISSSEISFFYHENKVVWLKTLNNKKYAVDYTLDQLEPLLSPKNFFRINRKFIVAYPSIQKVTAFTNSRLKLALQHADKAVDIIVSRERVSAFKDWLDG